MSGVLPYAGHSVKSTPYYSPVRSVGALSARLRVPCCWGPAGGQGYEEHEATEATSSMRTELLESSIEGC